MTICKQPKKYGKIWESLADSLDVPNESVWRRAQPWATWRGEALWGVGVNGEEYYSFDTMTNCVKYGYSINGDEIVANDVD